MSETPNYYTNTHNQKIHILPLSALPQMEVKAPSISRKLEIHKPKSHKKQPVKCIDSILEDDMSAPPARFDQTV